MDLNSGLEIKPETPAARPAGALRRHPHGPADAGYDGLSGHGGHPEAGAPGRKDPSIAGWKVSGTTDYLNDGTGLIPSDVLEFRLEDDVCRLLAKFIKGQ